ncbi:methylmalonyl-CoA mutase family protein [Hansschlegelia sp.]|uniref:methylmalonyl-CoA mutase family protein n=1 Tax=Hansschlegelia sp. TaxID=2041892 RepID=UPI002D107346|nr:methylmalonyl-CoA mutase family protein [Hansschlegelia sp.]HVI28128.1 methylmalonyl-CoA mutase family protein [Hansschlegelia sp.]
MTMEPIKPATNFAAEFPASEAEWRRAAETALKGRPLDSVLMHRTIDGLLIEGIAPRAAPRPIAGRPAGTPWIAMTRIDLADPAAANAQALEDLNNGATGLSLALAGQGDGPGLRVESLADLAATLDGVLLDLAPIHLDVAPYEGRILAAMFAALVERRGFAPGSVNVLFGIDLLRDLSRTGALPKAWPEIRRRFAGVVTELRERGFTSPIAMADARVAHCAGASDAQELATVLASATEHVRTMIDNGVDLEVAADAVAFAFACDAEQFASIAKLRAARLMWARWREEAGLPQRPVHIHAETSRRMMTRRDPHTNMVRTAIAAFAAGVGGADSLTVLPYTHAFAASDADGRRLARNAQSIILEESNAYRVADPAAGAGAIERLTDKLAEAGWEQFRGIERQGGLFEALCSGFWQERILETRGARAEAVATRRAPVVGVSEFPQGGEALLSLAPHPASGEPSPTRKINAEFEESPAGFRAIVAAVAAGATVADIRLASRPNPTASATPLDLDRLASPFEALRAANESAPERPTAFLALLGPIARHAARAGFIRNLLTAGGIATIDGPVGGDAAAVAQAFRESGAGLAIICGADDLYAEQGPALAAALRAAGGTVWLAGRPKAGAAELEEAGVGRFVAAGDNALDALREATKLASVVEPRAGEAS